MTAVAAHRHSLRDGTAAEWASINPVLALSEIGLETDTLNIKVGDGTTAWNDLDYWLATLASPAFTDTPDAPATINGISIRDLLATVYVLDTRHASTDASPVDATTHIQTVFDACETAGGGVVLIPKGATFFHTFNEVGESTLLLGCGASSVIKQMPGLTYASGDSFGLSCKTALQWVGFDNFTYDGNATASTDYADDYDAVFDEVGAFTSGNFKCANVAIGRLARGTLTDGTWVSPDHVFIDRVRSINATRSTFVFQMGTNRDVPGVVQAGALYAENSECDHLVYASESDTIQIASITCAGHWHNGALILSGAKIGSADFLNLTENPNTNPTWSYDFASAYCIDDRPDIRGSSFGAVSLVGDLAVLEGTDEERCLFRCRGFGTTARNVQIEHTGTDLDMVFRISVAEVGSTPGGRVEGPTITGVKARNMPSKTRVFSQDPNAWGSALLGGHVSDVYMTFAAGAASQTTALFEFKGTNVTGFTARDVYAETEDFSTAGPSAIYENATTTAFTDITFEHVVIRRPSNSNAAWVDATTVAANVTMTNCKTYGTATPSRAMRDAVERIINCTFGSLKIADNIVETIRKTADQSVSTTTLTSDSELTTWLRASGVYAVEVCLIVDADATGAFKAGWSVPSGATTQRATTVPVGPFATGTTVEVRRFATVINSTTAGFLAFRWAQNASSGTATIVKAGSFMRVRRIS